MKLIIYNLYLLLFLWGITDRVFSIFMEGSLTYRNVDTILFVGILLFLFTILNPSHNN